MHIRKYNEMSVYKSNKEDTVDLLDYLQEIIDKYKIKGVFRHGNDLHYSIESTCSYFYYISVLNVPENICINLLKDLTKSKSSIEKRLSNTFTIEKSPMKTFSYITNEFEKSYSFVIFPDLKKDKPKDYECTRSICRCGGKSGRKIHSPWPFKNDKNRLRNG